jgi:uncharacterized protein YecE (DUF72 family)
VKVTEKITSYRYPDLPRYGKLAGSLNPHFLDPDAFQEHFLSPLKVTRKIGVILFEFSQFYRDMISSGREFLKKFGAFLSTLNTPDLPIAVEIRNHSWITSEYFRFLSEHNLGHVFNSWTRMPTIGEQLQCLDHPLRFVAARVLLRPGRNYAQAVKSFQPYDDIRDEQPELRADAARLISRAIQLGVPAFIFVNNRAEGCAPKTIEGILERLNAG